jgi:hypothetical protein
MKMVLVLSFVAVAMIMTTPVTLMTPTIAFTGNQSNFDKIFQKCFANAGPSYLKALSPLNNWKTVFLDELRNMSLSSSYRHANDTLNIEVLPCMIANGGEAAAMHSTTAPP